MKPQSAAQIKTHQRLHLPNLHPSKAQAKMEIKKSVKRMKKKMKMGAMKKKKS